MDSSACSPGPVVTFWGAVRSVTGSMHLVEAAGRKILLDCGLVRGPHRHRGQHDGHFPFAPQAIDAVVLSHAHMDHCGNLPRLVHQGFAGPIYCTPATCELVALMLRNSARIHEEDAYVQGVIGRPDDAAAQPSYTGQDVVRTVQQCVTVPYGDTREVSPGIEVRLVEAGHILGSAMVVLTMSCTGRTRTLTFTGDLGRRGAPLLRDPEPVPPADLVISESTYGGRIVDSLPSSAAALEEVIRSTLDRGGKVLIPAFSLGRTQSVAHVIGEGLRAGRLPAVPVFIDSPLAADVTEVYRRHPELLDEQTVRRLAEEGDVLGGAALRYVRSPDESQELSVRREPCVIIAPSGMCDGGRILQHLKQNLDDPRCSVVLVNYQAPGTLGNRLLERGPIVRFHGRRWNKWADVTYLPGFSGHADRGDLMALLEPLADRNPRVRLVHGELEQAEMLAFGLREEGFTDVAIPARGEKVSLA